MEVRRCFKCHIVKPLDEFYKNRWSTQGRAHMCKTCEKTYGHDMCNDPKFRIRKRRYFEANKVKFTAHKYGMSLEEYQNRYIEQGGTCAVCGEALAFEDVCVDHNHTTGRVRGFVHRKCNMYLGFVESETEVFCKVLEYLEADRLGNG